jgi:hypothetical protein
MDRLRAVRLECGELGYEIGLLDEVEAEVEELEVGQWSWRDEVGESVGLELERAQDRGMCEEFDVSEEVFCDVEG